MDKILSARPTRFGKLSAKLPLLPKLGIKMCRFDENSLEKFPDSIFLIFGKRIVPEINFRSRMKNTPLPYTHEPILT
jgi:hypothetical protein